MDKNNNSNERSAPEDSNFLVTLMNKISKRNTLPNEDMALTPHAWLRDFMFGDVSATTHHFIEKASTRVPKEIGCAFAASSLVSPIVSIIDKCIAQEISGTAQFMNACREATKEMITKPKVFFGSMAFRYTWIVYFGTYAVANLSELGLDVNRVIRDEERKQIKVGFSAVANISLLAWRDSVFARAFGSGKAPASTPWRTISLFALRDTGTMYATFYAAPKAAKYIQKTHGVERNIAELTCALAIPVVTQVITAPFHIHAMDYYNRRNATMQERWATIQKEMGTVSFARGVRILPAFGLGSFSNNKFRELFIRQTHEDYLLMNHPLMRRMSSMVRRKKELDNSQ